MVITSQDRNNSVLCEYQVRVPFPWYIFLVGVSYIELLRNYPAEESSLIAK